MLSTRRAKVSLAVGLQGKHELVSIVIDYNQYRGVDSSWVRDTVRRIADDCQVDLRFRAPLARRISPVQVNYDLVTEVFSVDPKTTDIGDFTQFAEELELALR